MAIRARSEVPSFRVYVWAIVYGVGDGSRSASVSRSHLGDAIGARLALLDVAVVDLVFGLSLTAARLLEAAAHGLLDRNRIHART